MEQPAARRRPQNFRLIHGDDPTASSALVRSPFPSHLAEDDGKRLRKAKKRDVEWNSPTWLVAAPSELRILKKAEEAI